jgi:hypothetical protein
MKITKRQLRRLIKEEKRTLLREGQAQEEALFSALDQYVMVLDEEMGYDVPREQLKAEVLNFVDGYFVDTEQAAEYDEADQDYADQEYATKRGNPWDSPQNEGTSLNQMPSAWRQILGTCLKDKK